ncbi:MAG TPA: site-specific integrase, partial [Terriglobales bacterium]|nr:site-specific integrase [Terriglobales bacterium]
MSKKKSSPDGSIPRAIARFLRSLESERRASQHTLRAYRQDLERFAAWAGTGADWPAVDHLRIRAFLSHLYDEGLSKTSVARALAALRSLYRWMAREGMVDQNPAALVSTPR